VALNSAKVPNALLAGRILLLADDSITIQKVVELTFSDEGVSVVCANNGREAIERLEDLKPDVVLADVVMPEPNGYEICEYIKQNERLKHIPVMLLVGSFEPFDEAEARRVGADDTLTKPFQSIRRLIDKVGTLVGGRPSEEQIPTADLPRAEPEPEALTEQQLEVLTADTQPLPDPGQAIEEPQLPEARKIQLSTDTKMDEGKIDKVTETQTPYSEMHWSANDMLLDLGHFEPVRAEDEFVLDIDLDEVPEPAGEGPSVSAFAGQKSSEVGIRDLKTVDVGSPDTEPLASTWSQPDVVEPPTATADQFAKTQEFPRPIVTPSQEPETTGADADGSIGKAQQDAAGAGAGGEIALEQLSPEVIDAIARRAVEQLSEKVVQEIAWEVVPQLAELLIKRQLEEKSS
jgi:CheY-like chemotaxis protein